MTRSRHALLVAALVALSMGATGIAAGDVDDDAWDPTVECEATYPLEVTDGTGETVTLEEPPEEVVALQASDARTLYHIGAEDRVVGLPVEHATADLEVGDRTDISEDFETDVEQIVDLEPDIVIAASVSWDDDIDQLREAGITVYKHGDESSLDAVAESVLTVGELVDECDGAVDSVEWMDDRIQDVAADIPDGESPLAFYDSGGFFSPGVDTAQHDMLTVAGFDNLAAELDIQGWTMEPVSEEDVVDLNPEVIFYAGPEEPDSEIIEATAAYENDAIVGIDSNNASQPSPQMVHAIEEMAAAHDLVPAEEEEPAEEDDDDAIPAPGIVAAGLVAMLTVLVLARRQL